MRPQDSFLGLVNNSPPVTVKTVSFHEAAITNLKIRSSPQKNDRSGCPADKLKEHMEDEISEISIFGAIGDRLIDH